MATFNEPGRPLEFLIQEDPHLSREKVTIAAAAPAMVAGTVVGKITASGKWTIYNNGASDGTEAAAGILCYDVADSASDQEAVIIERLAAVKSAKLNWGANDSTGITAGTADLLTKNIKLRA